MRVAEASIWSFKKVIFLLPIVTAVCLGVIGVVNLALRSSELLALDEAGYGDSYIAYDILHLQAEGFIYRDLSKPPYQPAQYSPLAYFLLSLPGKLISVANPFLGPRLIVLPAFFGCLALVVLITRTLTRRRDAGLLALLIAASIAPLWEWILQLRSDFVGLLFSLLAIWFLLADRRRNVWYAGLCAGMAVQMKLTFVAAGVTGLVWLALRRHWLDLGRFALSGALTSAGLYLLYWVREPRMLAQITALSPGVPELPGAVAFAFRAALEPVVVVALLTAAAVKSFIIERGWQLLFLYAGVSAIVATATIIQAGANLNYYFEFFLACVPIATAGVLLVQPSIRAVGYGLTLAVVFACVVYAIVPRAATVSREISSWIPVSERNAQLSALASIVKPHRTFSTIPRLALFDMEPFLTEPFLLSYMHRLGRADYESVGTPLRNGRFEAVFTAAIGRSYRGIPHIDTELRAAITAAYVPYCIISLPTRGPILVHVPRQEESRDETLIDGLRFFGCQPVSRLLAERW